MKRSLAAFVFCVAAVLGGTPVAAQNLTDDPTALRDAFQNELSPESKELADKLVQLSGVARTFDALLPNIADRAKNSFIRANPQMQLGIIAVVDKVAVELVSRRLELDNYLARIWAAGFTNDEMRELIAFYESDLGKKFAQLHPKVLAVSTAAADDWANAVSAELDGRVRAELKAAAAVEEKALKSDIAGPAAEETAPQQ